MILLLYGDDTYRSRERLHRLIDAFRKKHDPSGMNTMRFDGTTVDADAIAQHFGMQGFLASRRFFAIENLLASGTQEAEEAVYNALQEHRVTDDDVLVVWEEGETPVGKKKKGDETRHALWKMLNTEAKVEHFPSLKSSAVTAWIQKTVQERTGKIASDAASALAAAVGSNLWQASSEIDKLIHYAYDRPITTDDLSALVPTPIDDNIFLLTDALGKKDAKLALQVLEDQFENGAAPLYVLRMLAWHVRNLTGVRSLLDDGVTNPRSIAAELKLHSFVVQKAIRQAEQFSMADLRALYQRLLDLDTTMKTRSVDPQALFTLMTTQSTRVGAREPSVRQ